MLRNRPGVEAVSGQLNQRVGGPAFAAPVIAVAMGLCEWFECRPDGRARCRVERPLDIERSIITVGQPQVALLGGLALSVGHTLGVRTMPGVHRVIPEAANAVFPGGLQERGFIERFSAVGMCDRLGVPRDDGGMRKTDLALSHGIERLRQV